MGDYLGVVWVLPTLETKTQISLQRQRSALKRNCFEVESKLRIEIMMAKKWEVLMKVGEESREGSSQKARGLIRLSLHKQWEREFWVMTLEKLSTHTHKSSKRHLSEKMNNRKELWINIKLFKKGE